MSPTPIAQRVPACPKCRYSWRGLPPEGACPECGLRFNAMSKEFRPRRPLPVFTLSLTIIWSLQPTLTTYLDVTDEGQSLLESLQANWKMFIPMLCAAALMFLEVHLSRRLGVSAVILHDGIYLRRINFSRLFIPWQRFESFIRPKFSGRRTVGYVDTSGGQQRIEGVFASEDVANEFVDRACAEVQRVHMMASDSNPSGDSQ